MKQLIAVVSILLAGVGLWLWLFLFRPFLDYPAPASLTCLEASDGHFEALGPPATVYGLGLSYAGHIAESPGLYDPEAPPPVFRKRPHSVNRSAQVAYPSRETLLAGAANVDAEHAEGLGRSLGDIPPLLDYEVEIGLAVRERIPIDALRDPSFAPPVGFFVANDLTARILIGMAPDFAATVEYLAEGKGLPGFLPVGELLWVPSKPVPNGWACVDLVTEVNGEVRQASPSSDIILAPSEILLTVAERFRLAAFERDDWIVTGTPSGVALQTAGWLQRALLLFDPTAETKVAALAGSASSGRFLEPGDRVVVRAGFLGEKAVRVAGPE